MSSPFQIESRPRWYALPQAITSVVWFLAALLGAFQLFKQLGLLSVAPIGYVLGSVFTYLGLLVSCIFVLRCSGAFKRSSYGPLRVISVDGFTKTLSILACIGSAVVLIITIFAWRDAARYEDEEGLMLGATITTTVVTLWVFFLTTRVVFGKLAK